MRLRHIGIGALLGALLTAPLISIMFLANALAALPFAPFDLFDWITRILPGPIITFGIDTMINAVTALGMDVADVAKTAEQISAVLMFFGGGVVLGAIAFVVIRARRIQPNQTLGVVLGLILGLPLIAIDLGISQSALSPLVRIAWLGVLFIVWGIAFSRVVARLSAVPQPATALVAEAAEVRSVERIDRRQFLIRLGASSAAITVLGGGLGAVLAQAERRGSIEGAGGILSPEEAAMIDSTLPNANDPVIPAMGTRSEITPIARHYKVFIRTEPTVIEEAGYSMPLIGLVDNPLDITLDDLRAKYDAREQYVTLTCISGRVGTSLIGTEKWTGVSLQDILADAGVQDDARYLYITSGDGFYETIDLDLIKSDPRIMLTYAWNDDPIPVDHGFPLRVWIPDLYGMKQPKWITGMEVMSEYKEGYWVERSWDEVARIRATSVVDTVAVNDVFEESGQRFVPVGGIAFSGARGISKVEVRVDGGAWQAAQLRSPLSETTWVIWRYDWPFQAGHHTFEVRCVEGDGTPQIEEVMSNRPSGATGIHLHEADL